MGNCGSRECVDLPVPLMDAKRAVVDRYRDQLFALRPDSGVREVCLVCSVDRVVDGDTLVVECAVCNPEVDISVAVRELAYEVTRSLEGGRRRESPVRGGGASPSAVKRLATYPQRKLFHLGYRVCRVDDGRATYQLRRVMCVRLRSMDAPEKHDAFGTESKQVLQALLPRGTSIQLWITDFDVYGRVVADVIRLHDRLHINRAMLISGWAWHYAAYDGRTEVAQLERLARSARLGIWAHGDENTPPWQSRRSPR